MSLTSARDPRGVVPDIFSQAIRIARWSFVVVAIVAAAHWGSEGRSGSRAYAADAAWHGLGLSELQRAGVYGGLCVQLGASQTDFAADLARSGRFLVHILDRDRDRVAEARRRLHAAGVYGVVSVELWDEDRNLPYTENLVNCLLATEGTEGAKLATEVQRVVCPGGVVFALGADLPKRLLATKDGSAPANTWESVALDTFSGKPISGQAVWTGVKKRWPGDLDGWTHPRHSASGNAVSRDTQVGPPRRIRWLAGPWQEVNTMVTSNGRNYYGGLIARDSFNGLRLWNQKLTPSSARGGFNELLWRSTPTPIAGKRGVFVWTDNSVRLLDGQTGATVRDYPEAGRPSHVLVDEGILIAVGPGAVKGIRAKDGELLWTHTAVRPRRVVALGATVAFLQGRQGEADDRIEVVALDKRTGELRWKRSDYGWLSKVTRALLHRDLLALEVSTLTDDAPGNAIHLLALSDGSVRLQKEVLPGMSHKRQARALFVGDTMWWLHGGRDANKKYISTKISGMDLRTGKIGATHEANLTHCFPPVATPNFFFSGEMDLTDLRTGKVDSTPITKAACGRANGWIPANGLVYLSPKHCVCWPMLRGYCALAPARPNGNPARRDLDQLEFTLDRQSPPPLPSSKESPEDAASPAEPTAWASDWPCYRHDAWRSGSTSIAGPTTLETVWSTPLGSLQEGDGPIAQDQRDNPFVKGSVTPPVIAEGKVFVARPDAHQVVALDAATGHVVWRFTANGRVDSPPTIHRGLCLFGSKSGTVYAIRTADGQPVWKMNAAPLGERIVAYGGLESPWPVPGSVLVVDDVAFFAAGRQSLADGGIFVFAVDPETGKRHWVHRLDSVPQKGFYESSGLEFDNFDLLFRQGDHVAMSRWLFDRKSGKQSVERWSAFARLNTGGGSAMVPQGCWTYGPRHQRRTPTHSPKRPLVVFRDNVLIGCSESKQKIYRRDFKLESGEAFEKRWLTGWAAAQAEHKGKIAWRSERLAKDATWKVALHAKASRKGSATVDAMVLAQNKIYVASSDGRLRVFASRDGKELSQRSIPKPLWDGLAIAQGRIFLATQEGTIQCLGPQ